MKQSFVVSILMLAVAVLLLAGSVFAWFALSDNSRVPGLEMELTGDGIAADCSEEKNGVAVEGNAISALLPGDVIKFTLNVRKTVDARLELTSLGVSLGGIGGDAVAGKDGTPCDMRDMFTVEAVSFTAGGVETALGNVYELSAADELSVFQISDWTETDAQIVFRLRFKTEHANISLNDIQRLKLRIEKIRVVAS